MVVCRAVDNALTLFRVWPSKNVGAIIGHANAAAYALHARLRQIFFSNANLRTF